jgi:hypothetical protein
MRILIALLAILNGFNTISIDDFFCWNDLHT